MLQTDLIFKDEVYQIVGAAMEVHTILGCGFLEAVYHEALELEFQRREMLYRSEVAIPIIYKGIELKKSYTVDFVLFDQILVEIKALDSLSSLEDAQLINYLKASNLSLGLLINFGSKKLEWKRRILTPKDSHQPAPISRMMDNPP